MRYDIVKIMNAVSMAGNATSSILDLRNAIDVSLQFIVTNASSPTGTVAIQYANDCTVNADGTITGGTFGLDATAPTPPVVTANGSKSTNHVEVGHLFCRVVFTTGTGTGNLTVIGAVKGA